MTPEEEFNPNLTGKELTILMLALVALMVLVAISADASAEEVFKKTLNNITQDSTTVIYYNETTVK